MNRMRSKLLLLLVAIAFQPGPSWANFGFAPDPGDSCLVAWEAGPDGPFYWTTPKRQREFGEAAWRRVIRDPDFKAKYEKQYGYQTDVLKPIGPAAEPLTPLPRRLDVQRESCLTTWTRYWKYLAATAPEADPARSVAFSFDPFLAAKGLVNVQDVGTGFFISSEGLLITNYHVAKIVCAIPKTGNKDSAIPCQGGYTLLSFTDWEQYVSGNDYVLLQPSHVRRDIHPLSVRSDLPRKWERVFLAGFPTKAYSPDFAAQYAKNEIYPSRNSGKQGLLRFLKWDPLVFSTGRLSVSMDISRILPNAPVQILLGSNYDILDKERPYFGLQEWDQDLESSPEEVPGGPGSSGSPLMDAAGRLVGVLHRDDMYYSVLPMVEALDLCNHIGSKNPARAALAERLVAQGLCRIPTSAAQLAERGAAPLRRLHDVPTLSPSALFDGKKCSDDHQPLR